MPPPPQPLAVAATMVSNNAGTANAGFAAPGHASVCLHRRSHSNISSIGSTQRIDKRFQGVLNREDGADGISIPLAMVLTLIATVPGATGVTVTGEAGPLHAALGGAPAQLTVSISRSVATPPTSESWREYVAVCPAFAVADGKPPVVVPIAKSSVEFMVSVNAADVLAAKLLSPPYTAVIEWLPTDSDEVVNVACPFAYAYCVPVPIGVVPSKNCTVPVGAPVVELKTVAVKVTDRPKVAGFRDDATVTELPA